MIENDLLYREKLVIIKGFDDRRIHNTDNKVSRTDDSLEDRQDKFDPQIDAKYVYRVPLKYFCDLGKINLLIKIDLKNCCTLEIERKILFESKKKLQPKVRPTQKFFP